VATAVLGDTDLTQRQKRVLLDVYDAFVRENREKRDPTETVPGAAAGG
jgi:hypothetical protein